MPEPDEVPKPWTESVLRKARKVRTHDIAFVEGAASLVLLGAFVAIDAVCEKKDRSRTHESWEERFLKASPASSAVHPKR